MGFLYRLRTEIKIKCLSAGLGERVSLWGCRHFPGGRWQAQRSGARTGRQVEAPAAGAGSFSWGKVVYLMDLPQHQIFSHFQVLFFLVALPPSLYCCFFPYVLSQCSHSSPHLLIAFGFAPEGKPKWDGRDHVTVWKLFSLFVRELFYVFEGTGWRIESLEPGVSTWLLPPELLPLLLLPLLPSPGPVYLSVIFPSRCWLPLPMSL